MVNSVIVGSGAWGTTLAKILCDNGHNVIIWSHDRDIASDINSHHENRALLKGVMLPRGIKATVSMEEACRNRTLVVLVTASEFLDTVTNGLLPHLPERALILSAVKGLDSKTNMRPSEVLLKKLPPALHPNIAVLSGPNLSGEIVAGKPATSVISAKHAPTAEKIQKIFNSPAFRVYTNCDVVGTELGGTLKNIVAIAAGAIDSLGLGDNLKSALMVRGLVEMSRFATAMGAKPETLSGLAGIGDLITTCSSTSSRNHFVGEQLGRGRLLPDILKGMKAVAEGVNTTRIIYNISRERNIEMPVTEQVYRVLFEDKPVKEALNELMTREPKPETPV
jgi:glycerol-3-phosphate dehydrogenase (NAD(P)+)